MCEHGYPFAPAEMSQKARALLDSLMGLSRDKAVEERTGEDFLQKNVCKHYLIGFCPNAALGGKIGSLEKCKKIHSEACIQELKKHAKREKYQKEYSDSLARLLGDLVSEADTRASREKRKKRPRETVVRISDSLKGKMEAYEETKQNLLRRAKEKAGRGDEAGKEADEHEAERAQIQINSIKKSHTTEFPGEEVCEACGVLYLLGDNPEHKLSEQNEQEHFASATHEGYVTARAKLAQLRDDGGKSNNRDHEEDSEPDKDKNGKKRRRSKDGKSEDDKERSREGDKGKENKKHKKEHDSSDKNGRDKDRGRDEDGKRKQDKDQDSSEDKKRDKDRDRDKDHRKSKKDKDSDHDRDRKKKKSDDKDKKARDGSRERKKEKHGSRSRSRDRDHRKGRQSSRDRDRRKRSRS